MPLWIQTTTGAVEHNRLFSHIGVVGGVDIPIDNFDIPSGAQLEIAAMPVSVSRSGRFSGIDGDTISDQYGTALRISAGMYGRFLPDGASGEVLEATADGDRRD